MRCATSRQAATADSLASIVRAKQWAQLQQALPPGLGKMESPAAECYTHALLVVAIGSVPDPASLEQALRCVHGARVGLFRGRRFVRL